jgi:hypothetical protein
MDGLFDDSHKFPVKYWFYVIYRFSNPFFTFACGSPAADYFLLRRQKKVIQEKATPVCRTTLQVAYPR